MNNPIIIVLALLCVAPTSTYGAAAKPRAMLHNPKKMLDECNKLAHFASPPKARAASLRRLSAKKAELATTQAHRSLGTNLELSISGVGVALQSKGGYLPPLAAAQPPHVYQLADSPTKAHGRTRLPPLAAHPSDPPLLALPDDASDRSAVHSESSALSAASSIASPSTSVESHESDQLLNNHVIRETATEIYNELYTVVLAYLADIFEEHMIGIESSIDLAPLYEHLSRNFYDELQRAYDPLGQEFIYKALIEYASYTMVAEASLVFCPSRGIAPSAGGGLRPVHALANNVIITYLELLYANLPLP